MISRAFAHGRLAALACALIFGAPFAIVSGSAQQAAPATPGVSQPAPAAPAAPAPAATPTNPAANAPAATPSPAPAASAPATPPSAPPAAPTPGANAPAATPPAAAPPTTPAAPPASPPAAATPGASGPDAPDDSSSGVPLEMTAHPAAYIEGKANWTEGFSAITDAFGLIRAELAKSGLTASGRPITAFTETDDTGFSYRAMIPVDKAPDGKTALSDSVKLGQTPAGKAMRFEHRGSYEDIDSTYEAITAYLDEKGLEAANLFVEEYLNDVKTPDDPNLQVDIYVLLK
ncbi:GyrI-like domain-containing protein [Methylocapsa sp. S129]|uniref:GyrI-like domain-containing protein n=1 Tax=Methylocapsa sp. S129 TaxID=1641869 RepID=UPI001AEEF627|nr:GyrI-like domain-containing protein [Methylocapsa sp. S129]